MTIRLVKEGVFPITRDLNGKSIHPHTGYSVPGTLQGEGKLIGVPSLFVRLSGCNLRCAWYTPDNSLSICDTPYSSHHADEWDEWETEQILATLALNRGAINHIVITGGEPMLQAEAVSDLAAMLKKENYHITLETNATLYDSSVARHIDLISMSPKLSSAIPFARKVSMMQRSIDTDSIERHMRTYRDVKSIQRFIDSCYHTSFYNDQPDVAPRRRNDKDFQLKFVVGSSHDLQEIKIDYLSQLSSVNPGDVVLMPLGETVDTLLSTTPIASQLALENGWKFTPRLQINLFGNKAGT